MIINKFVAVIDKAHKGYYFWPRCWGCKILGVGVYVYVYVLSGMFEREILWYTERGGKKGFDEKREKVRLTKEKGMGGMEW